MIFPLLTENKEGRGSLYDRHRERVRSVDKLIGKWDGTGQGQVKERGKDMGTFDKVLSESRICTFCIYERSLSSLLESQSKSSRRVRRTDGGKAFGKKGWAAIPLRGIPEGGGVGKILTPR
jgi:hypothetical protein